MGQVAEIRQPGSSALALNERELLDVMHSSLYPGASDDSIRLVLGYCKASGLDPMQKPVHIVPMWDKHAKMMRDVVMPGIGLYRTQAARSGQLAGIGEPEFGPDVTQKVGGAETTFPAWCRVTVKRRLPTGEIADFTATERWLENYAVQGGKEKSIAPNAMWARRPYAQLAKCAQAQALRMAFPEMTGAAPTADEMEGRDFDQEPRDVTPAAADRSMPRQYPAADFETNFPKWAKAIQAGRAEPDSIIAMVESKGLLTDAQKKQIRDCAVIDAETEETPE